MRQIASPTTRVLPLRARRWWSAQERRHLHGEGDFTGNTNYGPASATKTITIAKATAATVTFTWTDRPTTVLLTPLHATASGVGRPAENLGTASLTDYAGTSATGTPLRALRRMWHLHGEGYLPATPTMGRLKPRRP